MKKVYMLVLFLSTLAFAQGDANDKKVKDDKECTPPSWAVAIGHRDMWLKHHNCPPVKKKKK